MRKSTLGILISLTSLLLIATAVVATQPKQSSTIEPTTGLFSSADVAAHATEDDCWMIINNSVYDATSYVQNHPGGSEIFRGCGKDATELFTKRRESGQRVGSGTPHSSSAAASLESLKIGTLKN